MNWIFLISQQVFMYVFFSKKKKNMYVKNEITCFFNFTIVPKVIWTSLLSLYILYIFSLYHHFYIIIFCAVFSLYRQIFADVTLASQTWWLQKFCLIVKYFAILAKNYKNVLTFFFLLFYNISTNCLHFTLKTIKNS